KYKKRTDLRDLKKKKVKRYIGSLNKGLKIIKEITYFNRQLPLIIIKYRNKKYKKRTDLRDLKKEIYNNRNYLLFLKRKLKKDLNKSFLIIYIGSLNKGLKIIKESLTLKSKKQLLKMLINKVFLYLKLKVKILSDIIYNSLFKVINKEVFKVSYKIKYIIDILNIYISIGNKTFKSNIISNNNYINNSGFKIKGGLNIFKGFYLLIALAFLSYKRSYRNL
ncbi:hypothetical protein B0T21DRAFT_352571, partial [Apiosordaria backusii]